MVDTVLLFAPNANETYVSNLRFFVTSFFARSHVRWQDILRDEQLHQEPQGLQEQVRLPRLGAFRWTPLFGFCYPLDQAVQYPRRFT